MMRPSKKKLLTKAGIVFGVFFALVFVVILPEFIFVRQLSLDVQKTFHSNQTLQTMILTAKNAGNRLEVIQQKLADYKKRVLWPEDLTRSLDEIGSQAQSQGLNVLSLQALDEAKLIPGDAFIDQGLEIQQVGIMLKAEGRYQDIRNYFEQLEAMPYQVRVQTLLLKNTSAGGVDEKKEPVLGMEITLGVLIRLPQSVVAAPPRGGSV